MSPDRMAVAPSSPTAGPRIEAACEQHAEIMPDPDREAPPGQRSQSHLQCLYRYPTGPVRPHRRSWHPQRKRRSPGPQLCPGDQRQASTDLTNSVTRRPTGRSRRPALRVGSQGGQVECVADRVVGVGREVDVVAGVVVRRFGARVEYQGRWVGRAGGVGDACAVVNTCPSCRHVVPAASRSRCCCSWWSFSDWTQRVGRAMRRSEARVLVGSVVSPPVLVRWSARQMAAVPASGIRPSAAPSGCIDHGAPRVTRIHHHGTYATLGTCR